MVMFYAPHTLQVLRSQPLERDEYGKPVFPAESEWETVCDCRCDDNTTKEFRSGNGATFRPDFHVVFGGAKAPVKAGDTCRCLNADGSVRGEGRVYMAKRLNYLNYGELWLSR